MKFFNKHISLFVLFFSLSLSLMSQGISFYNDYLDNVWIFDNGAIKQIEHLPLKSYGVGNRALVYEDNAGGFKIYQDRFLHSVSTFVSSYTVTDNIISFNMNTQLKIFDNANIKTLCTFTSKYYADDDVVIWFDDSQKLLKAYWNDNIFTLDDALSSGVAGDIYVSENIAAFVDVNGSLNSFYMGEIEHLMYAKNLDTIALGRDVIAYVDSTTGIFQTFYKNEFVDLEDFKPISFKCGDSFIAYVDASSYLKVFDNFETKTISFDEPDFYKVEDEIMVFGVQNYFKAYVNGKVYTLEGFIPEKYEIKNNSVAYLDQMGNLKCFYGAKSEIISYEKVDDFELHGSAVKYSFGVKSENIYFAGKTFRND